MKNTIIKISILAGTIAINLSALESLVHYEKTDNDFEKKYINENSNEYPVADPEYTFTPGTTIGFSSIKSDTNELDENYIPFHGTPSHRDIKSYVQNIGKEEEHEKQERLQRSLELSNLLFVERQISERTDKLQACLDLLDLIEEDPYITSSQHIKELLKKYTKV